MIYLSILPLLDSKVRGTILNTFLKYLVLFIHLQQVFFVKAFHGKKELYYTRHSTLKEKPPWGVCLVLAAFILPSLRYSKLPQAALNKGHLYMKQISYSGKILKQQFLDVLGIFRHIWEYYKDYESNTHTHTHTLSVSLKLLVAHLWTPGSQTLVIIFSCKVCKWPISRPSVPFLLHTT